MLCQIVADFVAVVAMALEDLDLMVSVAEDEQFHGQI